MTGNTQPSNTQACQYRANSSETKVDASVLVSFGQYPVRRARFDEEPGAVALKDAGPHGVLDLAPGAVVNNDGIYPGQ